jgi:ferritin
MLSAKIQSLLNEQVNHEFYSSYLYLAMSAYCESKNLPGFARWMSLQSREEYGHALKFYSYIHDRTGTVQLQKIDQPANTYASPVAMFTQAYEHEQKISGLINKIYEAAKAENDYPTQVMLHWFITEQVEEERTALGIVEQLKAVGESPVSLIMMDRQLGARAEK